MGEIWRLLDTGLAAAARNVALNRSILEARAADEIPGTLRFSRCTPCVLLGYRDNARQVADVEFCRTHDIALQRRITSGSAAYLDERQLLWELYLHRRDVGAVAMRVLLKRFCHAAATALSALGCDARFRPPGDIEVDGRTLSTVTCAVDGEAILMQSALHIHVDAARIAGALRLSGNKIGAQMIDLIRDRAVGLDEVLRQLPNAGLIKHCLVEAFESEFDVELRDADLTLSEEARCQHGLRQLEADQFYDLSSPESELALIEAVHKVQGGFLRVVLSYDVRMAVIRQAWFGGDIVLRPRRTLLDLEAALRELPLVRVKHRIQSFFASRPVHMEKLTPADFVAVLRLAIKHPRLARNV